MRNGPVRGRCLGLLALAGGLALPAAGAAQGLDLRPCTDAPRTRCGSLTVPLDRSDPASPRLDLRVRVVPPVGARSGTLVVLAGGPGQAVLTPGAGFERALGDLAPGHEVVAMDARGTGATALTCAAFAGGAPAPDPAVSAGTVPDAVAACAAQLGPGRRHYTTAASVADLEALRVALGRRRVTLLGISYGTLVATAYARTHPAAVRALVLDSVVDPGGSPGVDLDTRRAARRVLRDICAGGRCAGLTRGLTADVARLEARLRRRGIPGVRVDARGRARPARFGGPGEPGALLSVLAAGDLVPAAREGFPAAVRAALAGDGTPLLRLADAPAPVGDDPRRFSTALFVATTCTEARLPWAPGLDAPARTEAVRAALAAVPAAEWAPFAPPAPGDTLAAACAGWPEAGTAALPAGAPPDVPALLLTGGADLRTPLESARRVRATLPRATHLVVRGARHSLISSGPPCVGVAVRRFLGGDPVGDPCRRADARGEVVPPAPRSLGAVPPRGLPGRRGRTLTAVRLSLTDLGQAAQLGRPAGGRVLARGLRGGRAELRRAGGGLVARLERYEVVAGVRLTGTLRVPVAGVPVLRVRVSGPAASPGRVVLRPGRASGRLGGRAFDVPL